VATRSHRGPQVLKLVVGLPAAFALALVAFCVVVVVTDDEASAADGGVEGVVCAPADATTELVGPYGPDQITNATLIVDVGTRRGVPDHGIVTALMAAMTESSLRNLDHGDRDSLGLFQMRPSQGWGTPAQLTDPHYAVNKFYDVLLKVPNWQGLPPGAAAQAVERSAFPDRYNKHEQVAREILGTVRGVDCPSGPESSTGNQLVDLPDNPRAETVVNAALSQLGVRYAWAGGTANGPSTGTGVDKGIVGFDCSGLALYAYAQIGVAVPHQTQAIWRSFQPAIRDPTQVLPGDLILLSNNGQPEGIHHVGIYMGNAQVVHAPQSGDVVKVTTNIWISPYWSKEFIGAVRPGV
jgi:cell wall-associated NlpC family hydrolase